MKKINCWEYKKCGKEIGGIAAQEKGICPASTVTILNKENGGINGGRSCWCVEYTLCDGRHEFNVSRVAKDGSKDFCISCDFYKLVVREEGSNLVSSRTLTNIYNLSKKD